MPPSPIRPIRTVWWQSKLGSQLVWKNVWPFWTSTPFGTRCCRLCCSMKIFFRSSQETSDSQMKLSDSERLRVQSIPGPDVDAKAAWRRPDGVLHMVNCHEKLRKDTCRHVTTQRSRERETSALGPNSRGVPFIDCRRRIRSLKQIYDLRAYLRIGW